MSVDTTDPGTEQVGPMPAPAPRRAWRSIILAPAGDGRRRRRGSDAFRLGLGVAVVLIGVIVVRFDPSPEHRLVSIISPPPNGISWLVNAVAVLGSFGMMAALVVLAFISGRRALARDVLVAGLAASGLCLVMWAVFGQDGGRPHDTAIMGFNLDYPLPTLTAAVAVATAAMPGLSRPVQRLVELLIGLGAVATVVSASGLPANVLASLALGWAVTAAVHLVFGSPLGLPSGPEVSVVLADLGVGAAEVVPSDHQVWGVARYRGEDPEGRQVDVSLYGRDAADAQMLAKTGRLLLYRDSGPTPTLTRLQHVEHEAYMTLLAERAGVDVPEVLVAGVGGPSRDAVLVTRRPSAVRLSSLIPPAASPFADPAPPSPPIDGAPPEGGPPDPSPADGAPATGGPADGATLADGTPVISDRTVDQLFGAMMTLRRAGIAHGAVNGDSIMVDLDTSAVWLTDFRNATSAAPAERLDADMAGALAVAALVVGTERAAAGVARVVPPDVVGPALTRLRRAGLDRELSRELRNRKSLLDDLRHAAATAVGIDVPELTEPRRVSWGTVILALGTLIGGWALIGVLVKVTESASTIKGANWAWVVVVFILSQLAYPAIAVSALGSVNGTLVYFRVVALEVADSFTALAGGTPAVFGTRVRFFQQAGYPVQAAVTSGVLVSTASWIVKGALFLIAIPLSWGSLNFNDELANGSSNDKLVWLLLLAVVGVLVLAGVVLAVPRLRRLAANQVRPRLADSVADLKRLSATPRKLVQLIGGAVVAQLAVALALGAALHAFGQSLPLSTLLIVITLASMLGGVSPVPGGMGVVEAGMILGLTAAGINESEAVAAVFVQRLFTSYLPPIWGWFTLVWMRKREWL
jgi:uncharacterized membrane protein YbhN (UPF0104 family)